MKRATYEDVVDVPILPASYFSVPPTWLCEVLAPTTERFDRTLEVLRLRDGAWTIVAVCSDSDRVRIEPFEAIDLELGRLWAEPPASAPAP